MSEVFGFINWLAKKTKRPTLIDLLKRHAPQIRVANCQITARPSWPGPACHGLRSLPRDTSGFLPQCWHLVDKQSCHICSSALSCKGLGMLGQNRRLEICQMALGVKTDKELLGRRAGFPRWTVDEGSKYTLRSRLTRSRLPRVLGGQKVKMWYHNSAGKLDHSGVCQLPCSALELSSLIFLTVSTALCPL